jgi:hypothetical protein
MKTVQKKHYNVITEPVQTSKRIILITGLKLIIVHDNQDSLQRFLDLFDMLQYD